MIKKDLPDDILIENVKKNLCNDSLMVLHDRYNKIYFDVCAKYSKKVPILKYDDLSKDDLFVLNRAIYSYNNKRKAKFSTWLSHMSRYHCLKIIKENSIHHKNLLDCDDEIWHNILNSSKNSYSDDNSFLKEFINNTLSKLRDKRILKIYKMRYLEDNKEWKDIAKNFNLTKTYVKSLHDIGRDYIKKQMEKDDLV